MPEPTHDSPLPADVRDLAWAFDQEAERIRQRREQLVLADEQMQGRDAERHERSDDAFDGAADTDEHHFGLALSGGGIRSATFALGALQGLSRASAAGDAAADPSKAPHRSLLGRFDYLSTVSGGGYIGAFFCSLFVPGRLWKGSDKLEAAVDAHRVLQHEPPGRIRSTDSADHENIRRSATAWLRENGRYLTPSGAGDVLYVAAMSIRNWFSMQYVIGTVVAAAFALLLFIRYGLAALPDVGSFDYSGVEGALLSRSMCTNSGFCLWTSPLAAIPLAVLALWLAPLTVAYWLTHPGQSEDDSVKPRVLSAAGVAAIVIAVLSIATGVTAALATGSEQRLHTWLALGAGSLAALGFLFHAVTARRIDTIAAHRYWTTRRLTAGLKVLLVFLVVALIDTLSQSLYLTLTRDNAGSVLSSGVLIASAVWLFRTLARTADRGGIPKFVRKLPISVIAGAAGVSLFLSIASLWGVLFHTLIWLGEQPRPSMFDGTDASAAWLRLQAALLGLSTVVFMLLATISGRFSSFLNLSTLHTFYTARLTRAYLGASNGNRYSYSDGREPADLSAAEPAEGDQLDHDTYYASLAPLHVINVTVNQTVDPTEQLVQRDRKGRPMAVLPTGFSIGRKLYAFQHGADENLASGLGSQKLTIGQWIAISGAAFTTGVGRNTRLGTSIALGLANVRLGMWWSSGYGLDRSAPFERAFKWLFKTQTFLFYEMMAKFHGLHREWHYLSDGGHFENTGLYELLHPGRKLRVIVGCDAGCDDSYQFADLANLVRLARIDHGLEIVVDDAIARDERLGRVFGTPEEFAAKDRSGDKCALLLNVYAAGQGSAREAVCSIILLKPTLVQSAPIDVQEYARAHPLFPQEPTTDQFFDQAQWESYRRLGLHIAQRVFGPSSHGGHGELLWRYLAENKTRPESDACYAEAAGSSPMPAAAVEAAEAR